MFKLMNDPTNRTTSKREPSIKIKFQTRLSRFGIQTTPAFIPDIKEIFNLEAQKISLIHNFTQPKLIKHLKMTRHSVTI